MEINLFRIIGLMRDPWRIFSMKAKSDLRKPPASNQRYCINSHRPINTQRIFYGQKINIQNKILFSYSANGFFIYI